MEAPEAPTPKVSLLVIRSSDPDRAVTFYRALGLGFTKHRHGNGPEHYAAEYDGFVFEVYPQGDGKPATSATRIGFTLASVDSAVSALKGIGAEVLTEPKLTEWGRRAIARDLDGHTIELVERSDSAQAGGAK